MKHVRLFENFRLIENTGDGEIPRIPIEEDPGREIEPENAEYPELKITFGIEQTNNVDNVLESLKKQGHIRNSDKKVEGDIAKYVLKFDSVYGVYLFGWHQAKFID